MQKIGFLLFVNGLIMCPVLGWLILQVGVIFLFCMYLAVACRLRCTREMQKNILRRKTFWGDFCEEIRQENKIG